MLGDVLHTAADAGRVHREGACESRELQSRPECAAATAHRGGRRMVWPGVSAQLRSPYTARGAHAAPARLKVSWPSGVVTVVEDANLLASHVNSMSRPLRCWEEGPPRATRAATTRATPTGDHKGDPKA